jgi:hypothetical protein
MTSSACQTSLVLPKVSPVPKRRGDTKLCQPLDPIERVSVCPCFDIQYLADMELRLKETASQLNSALTALRERLSTLEGENAQSARRIRELENALAAEREQNEDRDSELGNDQEGLSKELAAERAQRLGNKPPCSFSSTEWSLLTLLFASSREYCE